jgi:hypothetical protein
MAKQLQLTTQFVYNSDVADPITKGSTKAVVIPINAGDEQVARVQNLSIGDNTLDLGEVQPGWVWVKNRSATATIQLGPGGGGGHVLVLDPGEEFPFHWLSGDIHASVTEACAIEFAAVPETES